MSCTTKAGVLAVHASEGSGRPVVFIHGNSLSVESFSRQLSGPLGRQWRCLAPDLPGHGDSAPAADPAATYCLPGYSAALREAVSSLGLYEPLLVGHSLGGHIALQAIAEGLAVRGLFIFGTPPLGDPPDFAAAFTDGPSRGMLFRGDLSEKEIALCVAHFMPEGAPPPPYYARSIRSTDTRARDCLGASTINGTIHDERRVCATLDRPIAIVAGEHDRLVNLAYVRGVRVKRLWRGAVQIIPGAGHCPQYDLPEEFDRLLGDFLADTR